MRDNSEMSWNECLKCFTVMIVFVLCWGLLAALLAGCKTENNPSDFNEPNEPNNSLILDDYSDNFNPNNRLIFYEPNEPNDLIIEKPSDFEISDGNHIAIMNIDVNGVRHYEYENCDANDIMDMVYEEVNRLIGFIDGFTKHLQDLTEALD